MNQSEQERVITYVPQVSEDDPAEDLRGVRLGLYLYTNKLGLNYGFVLLISLVFQGFVSFFVGLRGWKLFFTWLPPEPPFQVIASILAVLAGFLFQAALIAEAAHVVWLRRTDKIKLRLEQDSGWWRVMVVVLGVLVAFDFLLLFMAMTGARDLVTAWNLSAVDQLTWFSTFGLLIMNLLTLLRCASVMNTSTTELNRRAVEERTKAIAEEILIDAGDATRSEALKVWRQLGTNPQKFVPLTEAVLALIHEAHPNFFPQKLGGDTWAYDLSSNSFTAITPNLHTSLLAARDKRHKLGDNGAHLWGMGPEELAEAISFNLKAYGKPRFVDFTMPDEPLYSFQPPASFEKVFNTQPSLPPATHPKNHRQVQVDPNQPLVSIVRTDATTSGFNLAQESFADKESFIKALGQQPVMLSRFAQYLMQAPASRKLKGAQFVAGQGVTIFDLFDLLELQFYYREFAGSA